MNLFDGVLEFRGIWRTYQERVLNRTEKYLADGKVHIVAAPGSGKTTLGIELIRRQGDPCLILSPSITIRQQWISRMEEGFLLEGRDPEDWFSNDIRQARPITAITYQALHSCMKRYAGVLREEEDEGGEKEDGICAEETVDYSGFDIYAAVEQAGIKTVCLDEAHHLRSEWWKALEEFLKKVPDLTVISLTATPPYDSTPMQWKRYIDLCGAIDEEIFTPELVQEGSLCPHQDYVYFNRPTEKEEEAVRAYTEAAQAILEELTHDREFIQIVSGHRGILSPAEYEEEFLEHPKYFSSILIFLREVGAPFPQSLAELIGGGGRLPRLDHGWLETLLQGFLYEDAEAYPCFAEYRESMIARLKAAGCIHRNKVQLSQNEKIDKLLMSSRGKLNSINEIVRAEYDSMGAQLRLLVLCDFIKKEILKKVGSGEEFTGELGAVPIFESIRRQEIAGIRLGVLSGSVVIVPADAEEELLQLSEEYGFACSLEPLGDTGYCKAAARGAGQHMVAVITELFDRGRIHVLVGTKSLLGEGWDSPCINSLVLATYVGSFMLSNQMRGRAIRVHAAQPEKTSNIWHLACIFPVKAGRRQENGSELAGDYETLRRRFDAFLGISCREDVIESGIERLGIEENRLRSGREIAHVNKIMLERAKDRNALRKAWNRSLKVICDKMGVEEVQEIDKELAPAGYVFINGVVLEILCAALLVLSVGAQVFLGISGQTSSFFGIGMFALMIAAMFGMAAGGIRLFRTFTPQKRLLRSAEGLLNALIRCGMLDEPDHCRAMAEDLQLFVGVYLKGGSMRDKTLFAACMDQLWGMIDNPRYLLVRKGRFSRKGEYYAVPDVFGRKKEDAECFGACMRQSLGPYEAVYTRTAQGRRLLLEARTKSFVNKNGRILMGKKQVKGEFE